jgi:hypothetical protein
MLWGQQIKVYTDHKNLTRDALGLTSDRVYRWRLLLEEFAPEIIYIKGIHNTVADGISRLEYNPTINATNEQNFSNFAKFNVDSQRWKEFSTLWHSYNENNPNKHHQECNLNNVFANCSNEEEIYPLTAQMLREQMQHSSTASSATMSLIKEST